MSRINRTTNIFVKIGITYPDKDSIKSWMTTVKSHRKTCCIAGCRNDIYCCARAMVKNGRNKNKEGLILICMNHVMRREEGEFPLEKQTGIVYVNEARDGMKILKKKSTPNTKKRVNKKDVFNY